MVTSFYFPQCRTSEIILFLIILKLVVIHIIILYNNKIFYQIANNLSSETKLQDIKKRTVWNGKTLTETLIPK